MKIKKDSYGSTYEHYSGKIYICRSCNPNYGNVAAYIPGHDNNGLCVIYRCELDKKHIEAAITANGWRLEDWL